MKTRGVFMLIGMLFALLSSYGGVTNTVSLAQWQTYGTNITPLLNSWIADTNVVLSAVRDESENYSQSGECDFGQRILGG